MKLVLLIIHVFAFCFSPCCKICKFTSLCYLGPTWASTDQLGKNYKPTSRYMLSTLQASLFLLDWNSIINLILGFKKLFIHLMKTYSLIKCCTDNYYYSTFCVCGQMKEKEKSTKTMRCKRNHHLVVLLKNAVCFCLKLVPKRISLTSLLNEG